MLGVADKGVDKDRVEQLYDISARAVGRKFVVGVRREADALGESMEAYFVRIKTTIENSDLSEPLKAAVLAGMSFNDYFGLGIVIINVPAQTAVSTIGERVFARQGDSTIEVTGRALLDVASRFLIATPLVYRLAARPRLLPAAPAALPRAPTGVGVSRCASRARC